MPSLRSADAGNHFARIVKYAPPPWPLTGWPLRAGESPGAGPRASQYLVLGAKCHAAIKGKYSPDIEDVQAIAKYVLRHRIVRNYKAEAEGITEEKVIDSLV